MDVEVIPRAEFLHEVWDYRPGEHVTLIGHTQSGKTQLGFELLEQTVKPDLPAIVLVMKPKDPTPTRWGKRLGFKTITTWPPPSANRAVRSITKPRGWVVWPKLGNIREDNLTLRMVFESALAESYAQAAKRKGAQDRIIFVDEIIGVSKQLGLEIELDAIWMRGSSMGLGLWAAGQRPFNMPLHAYNAAAHLFLHKDPDERNIQRYKEIGGIDPDVVQQVTRQLALHEFLYIRRRDYSMAVVAAD